MNQTGATFLATGFCYTQISPRGAPFSCKLRTLLPGCVNADPPDEYRKIAETYYRLAREAKTEADRLASVSYTHLTLPTTERV